MAKKLHGKVERSDLEGGYLTISDGKHTYKLEGAGPEVKPGMTVELEGTVEKQSMGIGFGLPVFRVKAHKQA